MTGSFRIARRSVAQLGLQAQDVAVGLASGQSPFTVLAAFTKMGSGINAAEAAASSFKTALDGVNDTVGSGVTAAERLTKAYDQM